MSQILRPTSVIMPFRQLRGGPGAPEIRRKTEIEIAQMPCRDHDIGGGPHPVRL